MAKGYNLTFDYVLYNVTYANLILYSSVLPRYDDIKEAAGGEIVNADDPSNKDKINSLLFGK